MAQKAIHVDNPEEVGRRVQEARRSAGLTLRDLAFPGCSVAYLSQIERGKRTPSLQVVVELARKLRIDPQYLAKGESNGKSPQQAMSPLRIYRRALASARTPAEQVWVLAGLAQAAAAEGDLHLARNALEQALDLLPRRQSPALAGRC